MAERIRSTVVKHLMFVTKDSISGSKTVYDVHPSDVQTLAFHIPFPDALRFPLKDLALLAGEISGESNQYDVDVDDESPYLEGKIDTPFDMFKEGNNVVGAFFVAKDFSSGNESFYEVNYRGIARFSPHVKNVSRKKVHLQQLLLMVWKLMGNAIGNMTNEDSNEKLYSRQRKDVRMAPLNINEFKDENYFAETKRESTLNYSNEIKLKEERFWMDVSVGNGIYDQVNIDVIDPGDDMMDLNNPEIAKELVLNNPEIAQELALNNPEIAKELAKSDRDIAKEIELNNDDTTKELVSPKLEPIDKEIKSERPIKSKKKKKSVKLDNTESLKLGRKPSKYVKIDGGGWKCTRCDMILAEKHYFRNHTDTCFDPEELVLRCGGCSRTFKEVNELKLHLTKCSDCNKIDAMPTLICEQCQVPRVFSNVQKYEGHVMRHQELIPCKECDASFKRYETYVFHIRDAHTQRAYQCDRCHKSYAEQEILDRHKANWHVDHYCDVCGNKYKSNHALMMHMERHEIGPFPCPKCPKLCQSKNVLVYHMKRHNGDLRFTCEDCGKKFIAKDKLQIHIRSVHTNERPFTCETCGKTFVRSDKMAAHKRRFHTFEKPYSCDKCDWRGVEASDLCHHKKRHLFDNVVDKPIKEQTEHGTILPLNLNSSI